MSIVELQKEQEQIDQQLLNAGCMSEGLVNPYLPEPQVIATSPEEIRDLENEIDRLTKVVLTASTEIQVSHAFLDVFLDETEAIWDRTKELASPEIAVHYLAAAQHRRNQGRTGDRISDIQNWIDRS